MDLEPKMSFVAEDREEESEEEAEKKFKNLLIYYRCD